MYRRCNTCGEYIYKGKKFNARKETVEGEDYYGIKIFRFYIKWYSRFFYHSWKAFTLTSCSTLCSAEITFKTDPKNTDYTAEHGASRNFEPWREEKAVEEEDRLAKLEEEENNPMKALENRTVDSKREMERLDALQDMRARNARNERLAQSVDLLATLGKEEVETEEEVRTRQEEEEDEKVVQAVFSKVTLPGSATSLTVKRKAEGEEPGLSSLLSDSTRAVISSKMAGTHVQKKKKTLGIKITKKS